MKMERGGSRGRDRGREIVTDGGMEREGIILYSVSAIQFKHGMTILMQPVFG